MKFFIHTMIMMVLACSIVACSGGDSSDKPTGVIPEAPREALDRAKEVEAMMIEADQKRRQQIDQSTEVPH